MSYWPRCVLTDEEKKWVTKYYDPDNPKPAVKRRFYPGLLKLTEQSRNPIYNFNVARRTKVFGLDFAGDLAQFLIQIADVTGELYTPDPVQPNLLVSGSLSTNEGTPWYVPETGNDTGTFPWRQGTVLDSYPQTYIFEPEIILLPNQTLTITGSETGPPVTVIPDPPLLPETIAPFRIDFTLHVWEYPGMDGGAL